MLKPRGNHVLILPEGAELLTAAVDNHQCPLRLEGRRLTLPVSPGRHTYAVNWRQPGGMRSFFRTPAVDLGAESVNAAVYVNMPDGRWTLLLGGPGLGPAVLFWAKLAVFLAVGAAVSKLRLSPLTLNQWLLLSVGLTRLGAPAAAFVAGWFILISLRGKRIFRSRELETVQVSLACYTFFAAALLLLSLHRGLLGSPEMQIAGNGSSAGLFHWYVDRRDDATPRPWIVSVPLGAYRVLMLAWALWLARSILAWTQWAWKECSFGGLWSKAS